MAKLFPDKFHGSSGAKQPSMTGAVRRALITLSAGLMFAPMVSAADNPVIEINDIDTALETNIRAHLRIGSEACNTPLVRLRRLSPRVSNNVDKALQGLGYYNGSHSHTFTQTDSGCWQLHIDVQPGEQVRIRDVDIRITGDPEAHSLFASILQTQQPEPGAVLHQGRYESLKSAISTQAVEYGYFASRFTESELAIFRAEEVADIRLVFDTGERFRFGELRVDNNTRLNDQLIQRMITLEAGQPYASDALFEQRENLNRSQFFAGINIYPELGNTSDRAIPVDIELEPRPRHVYSAGLGFTTDTGPRLRLAYDDRYVNRRGHSLETDVSLSTLRNEFDVLYNIPLADPTRETLQFRGGFLNEETDTYESDLFTLRTNYLKELENGWLRDIFINYQLEDYVVEQEDDRSTLTIVGMSFSRSRADNPVFTTRGWSLFTELRGADESLLSDTTFAQLSARARHITSLGRLRFLSRLELGTTWISGSDTLPASLRYFAGGDRSLRGYKYQTLGPKDEHGEVIGGSHSLIGSLEMDVPVANNWRLAMFYDVGNAFASFDDIDWRHTVGFGIRWISPIGPIRVDLGHPLRDGGVRLHITMGPDL